jgi:hypothetical protein
VKILIVLSLAISWGIQARAQTIQAAMNSLNATPFNCEAFRQTVKGPDGYKMLSTDQLGDRIIDRLLAVADVQCQRDFLFQYSWDIEQYGAAPPPPEASQTAQLQRPRCLPWVLRLGRPCPAPPPPVDTERAYRSALQLHERSREQTLKNLRRLTTARHGDASLMASGQSLMCLPQDQAFDFLLAAARDNRAALSCLRPAVGEAKIVNFKDEPSPTGTGTNYTIVNTGNGNHEILIPIQFQRAAGATVDANTMMNRARNCMNELTPYMRGPAGQQLNIRILNDQELAARPLSQRPEPNIINVIASGTRTDRDNYESDIDCPTIAHEMLHILGLSDEYRETIAGFPGSCRALPDAISIMRDPTEAVQLATGSTLDCRCDEHCQKLFANSGSLRRNFYFAPRLADMLPGEVIGRYCRSPYEIEPRTLPLPENGVYPKAVEILSEKNNVLTLNERRDYVESLEERTFICACPVGANPVACEEVLASIRAAIRNPNSVARQMCPNSNYPRNITQGISGDGETTLSGDSLRIVRRPTLPSLLHPAHYERIVGGNCPSVTPQYNECARWAYRDLRDANGDLTNECPGRPVQCSDPAYFLGVQ